MTEWFWAGNFPRVIGPTSAPMSHPVLSGKSPAAAAAAAAVAVAAAVAAATQ